MSLAHLRVQLRSCGGYWWFRADQYQPLLDAIRQGAVWVELLDHTGSPNAVNVGDIVAFYVWTPENYDSESAFSEAVRDYCGVNEDGDDELLPGDEWKRGQ